MRQTRSDFSTLKKVSTTCQRRSKNLPDGGVKVGHCSGEPFAIAGGVKVIQCLTSTPMRQI